MANHWRLIALLPCMLLAAAVPAATLEFSAAEIRSPDWVIDGLHAVARLEGDTLDGSITLARVQIPGAGLDLADTVVDCGSLQLTRRYVRCTGARVSAHLPLGGRQQFDAELHYERDSGDTRFEFSGISVAGGTLAVRGATGADGSRLDFEATTLDLGGVLSMANMLGVGPDDLAAAGSLSASGKLVTQAGGDLSLQTSITLNGASLSNELGTLVADAVDGELQLTADRTRDEWRFGFKLLTSSGEAYAEPVYANLSQHAVILQLADVRTSDFARFDIGSFRIEQASLLTLSGNANVTVPVDDEPLKVHSASVDIVDTSLAAVYTSLLQITAAGTILGDLETAGRINGHVELRDNAPQSGRFQLTDIVLDDKQRRFAVYGLSGSLYWPGPAGTEAAPSRLRWDSASVRGILLDAAEAELQLGDDDIELLQPLRIPTMGGALRINRLAMRDYGSESPSGLLDAELEPIQLGQLTGAFGWPAFSGSLSGRLPLLQYEGNAMTVGGRLTAQAFDGDIEIGNLRIAQPFGLVPRMQGDIRLRNMDLERLTNTFEFGLIQGRLSGDVTGLQLVSWRPVAMELHLYTPEGDRSPHRISQRAVENLASVGGGGAGAVLSGGLLKFFEVFAYDRIGLRCVLADGVCAMSGAGAAGQGPFGQGYYIVKGSGVPRIDVVGYRSRVNWRALVQQLANITGSNATVVN